MPQYLWLIIGAFSYLSYAITSVIDKDMMNHGFAIFRTNALKTFFNTIVLFLIGSIFFDLQFNSLVIIWGAVMGTIAAISSILYFTAMKLRDVNELMSYFLSASILLIFLGSLIFLHEQAHPINFLGITLVLLGIYTVLYQQHRLIPKLDKAFLLISIVILMQVAQGLILKKILFTIQPINLVISMNYFATLILLAYQLIFRKHSLSIFSHLNSNAIEVLASSLFASLGLFLFYWAISLIEVYKAYALSGLEVIFIFIIAIIFLKEKFRWYKLAGTIAISTGVYFIFIQ